MGKKGKKSRFNQVVDIDFTYSSTSVVDGGAESALAKLNLSREKVSELQRIKAQLPSAPQSVRIEEEIAQIPDSGPFRILLANVAYVATRDQIEEFFLPIVPTQIKIVEEDGRCRGYCFVDFANRADLTTALDKNGGYLSGRRVTMRIAGNQNDREGGGSFGSGRRGGPGGSSGFGFADPGGWNRRQRDPDDFQRGSGGFDAPMEAPADGWRRGVARPSLQREEQPGIPATATAFRPAAQPSAPPTAELPERPIIRLVSRTKTLEPAKAASDAVPRNPSIFGEAKPVDTAAREREIEERMLASGVASEHKPLGRGEPASPPGGLRTAAPQVTAPAAAAPVMPPASAPKPQAPPVNAWSQRKQQQQQPQAPESHSAAVEPKKLTAQPQQPGPPQQPKPQANAWKKPLVTAGDEQRP